MALLWAPGRVQPPILLLIHTSKMIQTPSLKIRPSPIDHCTNETVFFFALTSTFSKPVINNTEDVFKTDDAFSKVFSGAYWGF